MKKHTGSHNSITPHGVSIDEDLIISFVTHKQLWPRRDPLSHHRFLFERVVWEASVLQESLKLSPRGWRVEVGEPSLVTIPAVDGYPLAARYYRASAPSHALVIINSATAVKQNYYRRFALYLNDCGFDVLTYDYRGVGRSAPETLRGFHARMRDWGQIDFPGVIDWCVNNLPHERRWVVGHSIGGQILGLAPNNHHVAGLVGVGAQLTWWKLWPKSDHVKLVALWYFLMPTVARVMGYFPSPWFGLGDNLPKGVAIEWAEWARTPGHIIEAVGEHVRAGYRDYCGEILGYSMEDDHMAPKDAVSRFLELFESSSTSHRHVSRRDFDRPIGHFGYFREEFKETLWAETTDWLHQRSTP